MSCKFGNSFWKPVNIMVAQINLISKNTITSIGKLQEATILGDSDEETEGLWGLKVLG